METALRCRILIFLFRCHHEKWAKTSLREAHKAIEYTGWSMDKPNKRKEYMTDIPIVLASKFPQ